MVNEFFLWNLLDEVKDPEIPVLSIVDLGIVKSISIENNKADIRIIPTYTSCPAMEFIKNEIINTISKHIDVTVKIELSPVWTSDLINEKGRESLLKYGIAPPNSNYEKIVECPICKSNETEIISTFGSTACKASYRCKSCLEPFDYFKCHK